MSERVPTEQEWGLILGVLLREEYGWSQLTTIPETPHLARYEDGMGHVFEFNPLHSYDDLARLVEAMQAAGYKIIEVHHDVGKYTETKVYKNLKRAGYSFGSHRIATFWAIVEALEKEKRDGNTTG